MASLTGRRSTDTLGERTLAMASRGAHQLARDVELPDSRPRRGTRMYCRDGREPSGMTFRDRPANVSRRGAELVR
jgi:hypothetical protein